MTDQKQFKYDAFVSYRWVDPDQQWVREQLVPALQQAGLKVCLDVEDFTPGRFGFKAYTASVQGNDYTGVATWPNTN